MTDQIVLGRKEVVKRWKKVEIFWICFGILRDPIEFTVDWR